MEPEGSSHREQRKALGLEICPAEKREKMTMAAASYVKRETALSLHDIIHWIFGCGYSVLDLGEVFLLWLRLFKAKVFFSRKVKSDSYKT